MPFSGEQDPVALYSNIPRLIPGLAGKKVVDVAAGGMHSVICTDEGEVYTFGNSHNGQCGHGGREAVAFPRRVSSLVGKNVVKVAASCFLSFNQFTLCKTSEGQIWTFGGLSQLDDDGDLVPDLVPRCVQQGLEGKQVVDVAAGAGHAVVITSEGEVLTWGSNVTKELGYTTLLEPGPWIQTDTAFKSSYSPNPRVVEALADHFAVSVAAALHTVVCMRDGTVYTWGNNDSNQLGSLPDSYVRMRAEPERMVGLENHKVFRVAAAPWHTIVATRNQNSLYEYTDEPISFGNPATEQSSVDVSDDVLEDSGSGGSQSSRFDTTVEIIAGDDGSLLCGEHRDPFHRQRHLLCQMPYLW